MQTSKRLWSAAVVVALMAIFTIISFAPAMAQDVPMSGNGQITIKNCLDFDLSGFCQDGEPGIAGVTYQLLMNDQVIAETVSSEYNAAFYGLADGHYTIKVIAGEFDSVERTNTAPVGVTLIESIPVVVSIPYRVNLNKLFDSELNDVRPRFRADAEGNWFLAHPISPQPLGNHSDQKYDFDQVMTLMKDEIQYQPQWDLKVQNATLENGFCQDTAFLMLKYGWLDAPYKNALFAQGWQESISNQDKYQIGWQPGWLLFFYNTSMRDCAPEQPQWLKCLEQDGDWSNQGSEKSPFQYPNGTGVLNAPREPGIWDKVDRLNDNGDTSQCLCRADGTAVNTKWWIQQRTARMRWLVLKLHPEFAGKPESGREWDQPSDGLYLWSNQPDICKIPVTPSPTPTPMPTPTPTPTPTKASKVVITKIVISDDPADKAVKFVLTINDQPAQQLSHGQAASWTVPAGVEVCLLEKDVDKTVWDVNIIQTSGAEGPIVWAAAANEVSVSSLVFPGSGPKVCTTVQPGETQEWTVTNTRLPEPPPPAEKHNVYLPAVKNEPPLPMWSCPAEAKAITVYPTREAAASAAPESHGWVKFTLSGRAVYYGYQDGWAADPHTIFAYPVGPPRRVDLDVFFDDQQVVGEWQPVNHRNVAVYRPVVSATHVSIIRVTNTENLTGEVCVYNDPEQH